MEPRDPKMFYEEDAPTYDEQRWMSASGNYGSIHQLNLIRGFLQGTKGGKALEIGAGTGRVTKMLLNHFDQVIVYDISPGMLSQLEQQLSSHPRAERLRICVGDARETEFEPEIFDAAICINAVSHIPNQALLFKEAFRMLKPGGILIFNYPNWLSPYLPIGAIVNLRGRSLFRGVYTRWFTHRSIQKLLNKAGFTAKSIRGQMHIPKRFPDMLLPILRIVDRLVAKPPLAYIATNVIIKAVRKIE